MFFFRFYLLACAALVIACQPVTPKEMRVASPSPQLITKEAALSSSGSSTPSAPPMPSLQSEASSTGNFDQNSVQTNVDITIDAVPKIVDSQNIASQKSSNITEQMVVISKTFDPTKIIGFAAPILVRDLGKASMIRQEGSVEVWQYQFASCVVDFFFYPADQETSQLIAKGWDMRSAIIGDFLDQGSCRVEMDLYHRKKYQTHKLGGNE